jgi:Ca2+-binding RTX toxin-like protein
MRIWGGDGDDTLTGGALNDVINGGGGFNKLVETAATHLTLSDTALTGNGADSLTGIEQAHLIGTSGANKLDASGFTGPTTLEGLGGNDTLTGGQTDDVLRGGPGNDVYIFKPATTAETDTVEEEAAAGTDRLDFSSLPASVPVTIDLTNAAALAVHGSRSTARTVRTNAGMEANFEDATGGAGDDALTGNAANNKLIGGKGNDVLMGGPGHDFLTGGPGNDTLVGGDGNDTYIFAAAPSAEIDWVHELAGTGTGVDLLSFAGLNASTPVWVDLNLDSGMATHANRTIHAGPGEAANFENVTAGAGDDTLIGNAANNKQIGGKGNDVLIGGPGNDSLTGGPGNDTLTGGDGNDTYIFATAAAAEVDWVHELAGPGTGIDLLSFSGLSASTLLWVDLNLDSDMATHANRTIHAGPGEAANFENVTAGAGNDTLIGNAANNKLIGGKGNDMLSGLGGNDNLLGGAGNDTLVGGLGSDVLQGQVGSDLFFFDGTAGADDIDLNLLASNKVKAERRDVGSSTLLEAKTIIFDSADFIHVRAFDGDDQIDVAATITGVDGKVDGGEGIDVCSAPDAWEKVNCEL